MDKKTLIEFIKDCKALEKKYSVKLSNSDFWKSWFFSNKNPDFEELKTLYAK